MNEPKFPLSLTAILVFMGFYLAALAWLGIAGKWTAFIIVTIVGAPLVSTLFALRSRAMREHGHRVR